MTIAAIVPTLEEEARIGATLDALRAAQLDEILVVDGGSSDATVAIAEARGVRVIQAPRGRARQQNAGARATTAPMMVFVHADVLLPKDAAAWIRRTLATPGVVAGAFRTRTRYDGAAPPPRNVHSLPLVDLRSRLGRVAYGDQAIFMPRATFDRIGGFPDMPLLEDLEISRRLRRLGAMPTIEREVIVSARRFIAHPWLTAACCLSFPLLYDLGVSPATLGKVWKTLVR